MANASSETDAWPIRSAELADAPFIVEANLQLAWESEQKRLDRELLEPGVRQVLDDPSLGRYFIAYNQAGPVGQLMLTTEWSDWRNGAIWWIQSVYVVPECRGQGVYRALHSHVARLGAEEPGVVGLRLYVEHANHARKTLTKNWACWTPGISSTSKCSPNLKQAKRGQSLSPGEP